MCYVNEHSLLEEPQTEQKKVTGIDGVDKTLYDAAENIKQLVERMKNFQYKDWEFVGCTQMRA